MSEVFFIVSVDRIINTSKKKYIYISVVSYKTEYEEGLRMSASQLYQT